MAKTLKLWNGRGYVCRKFGDVRWTAIKLNTDSHAYIAAYSRADARRLIQQYCGNMPPDSELREYWNSGSWGASMAGITPERGLWLQFDQSEAPIRVV